MDLAGAGRFFINGLISPDRINRGDRDCPPMLSGRRYSSRRRIQPLFGGDQFLCKLGPPGRMGKVPRSQKVDSLSARPKVQMGGITVTAGSPGIFGMDMQIGNKQNVILPAVKLFYYNLPGKKTNPLQPRAGSRIDLAFLIW